MRGFLVGLVVLNVAQESATAFANSRTDFAGLGSWGLAEEVGVEPTEDA
jgi:hypothetical protein